MVRLTGAPLRVTTGTHGLRGFPKVWDLVYAGDPDAVRPFQRDLVRSLGDTASCPRPGSREFFLVRDNDGRPLARAVAWFDTVNANRFDVPTGFFSHFECVDSADVAATLLAAVRAWLSRHGATRIVGPMSPRLTDELGVRIAGHGRPVWGMAHNPPYYPELLVDAGFIPAEDLRQLTVTLRDDYPRLRKLAEQGRRRWPGLIVRGVRVTDFENEVRAIIAFHNRTFVGNWGFIPVDPGEFWAVAKRFRGIYRPEYGAIAELHGEMVGMLITIPDVNQILHPMRGRLWPFGWRHLVRGPRRIRDFRTVFLGVERRFRLTGIEAVLLSELHRNSLDGYDIKRLHATWILESNGWMHQLAEQIAGPDNVALQRFRVYRADL